MSTPMLSTPSTHHSKHVSKASEYKGHQPREHASTPTTRARQARKQANMPST